MNVTELLVSYKDGPGAAAISPNDSAKLAGLKGNVDVLLGWVTEDLPWLSDPSLKGSTFIAGYACAPATQRGALASIPIRLSAIPAYVNHVKPDLVVVGAVRRGKNLAYGPSLGWGPALIKSGKKIIIEVDEDGFDFGGPIIECNPVAVVSRSIPAQVPSMQRSADEIDLKIGELVVSLFPSNVTLQFGPGGIGEGIARAISKPVQIWSGLLTDAVADLNDRGMLRGTVTCGYAWGGESIRDLMRKGLVDLQPIEVTHDLTYVSKFDGFVGCNTALQVGLDGSVNLERVGGRIVSSIGGHADYCTAATRSKNGISIIALRSTTRNGKSCIVPQVEVVSTQRSDIECVVTEHGIADLRGCDDEQRARKLIAIAAPEHRSELLRALEQGQ